MTQNKSEAKLEKNVRDMLYGLNSRTAESFNSRGVRTYLTRPPTDLTRLTLQLHLKQAPFREEKSEWWYDVSYDGVALSIYDWKGAYWGIGAPNDSDPPRDLLDKLEKRIAKAGNYLYRSLLPELRAHVQNETFYVLNSYSPIQQMYQSQRDRLLTLLETENTRQAKPPETVPNTLIGAISQVWRPANSIEMSAQCVSATAMFFSYLDVLLDISFMLFGNPIDHYLVFRRKDWRGRVRKALGEISDRDQRTFFERLETFKAKMRDSALHGTSDHLSIIVPVAKRFMIPLSTRGKRFQPDALTPNVYWPLTDAKESAESALKFFDEFDSICKNNSRLSFALVYGQGANALCFGRDALKDLRSHMSSPEELAEHLHLLSEAAEAQRGY